MACRARPLSISRLAHIAFQFRMRSGAARQVLSCVRWLVWVCICAALVCATSSMCSHAPATHVVCCRALRPQCLSPPPHRFTASQDACPSPVRSSDMKLAAQEASPMRRLLCVCDRITPIETRSDPPACEWCEWRGKRPSVPLIAGFRSALRRHLSAAPRRQA